MIDSIKRISLDIQSPSSNEVVNAKRGDTSRKICISLVDGGVPYTISKDCYAVFTAKKPDKNVLYNCCTIENNTIIYQITPQTVAVEGRVNSEIKLYGADDKLITSAKFTILVHGTVYNEGDEVESTSEFSELNKLHAETNELKEYLEALRDLGFIHHEWKGTVLSVTSAAGTTSADLKGKTGPKGDKGETGPQGDKGETGPQGDKGETGPQGDKGETGPQGPKGDKGDKGETGPQGPQGPAGADGKPAYEYAQEAGYAGTEAEFAEKLAKDMPDALPNPHPLTINGKSYDGSEAVDITVTGGATSENTSLGQTPVTLTKSANIKLVGNGEYSYTINGKTIADVSTATVAKTNATLTEKDGLLELTVSGSPANWYSTYAAFTFTGLTAGESYVFCIESLGLDNVNLNTPGYFLIKNTSGTELGRINSDTTGLISVAFTADTETIVVSWYPANNYYWSDNYRTARVGDIYINKASDGTDRTGVINESGTFTDSYSFGQLQKGITITSTPSCEVYSVSVGGGSSEVSASLAGKTVVCFGDSLFGMYTGDTSAPAFVAQKTGATVHNVGFGGCRMSEHPYTGYNEFCMYALADAIASGDWSLQDAAASSGSSNFPDQLAILKSIDFNAVDYIVIHYGTNDFAAGGGVTIDNASNPKATNTLCGALRHSVETLLAAFPKLKIFVSLPAFRYWTADDGTVTYSDEKEDVNGCTLPDFVKALADTAKEYKLPVIDCYYGLGINKSNAATFLADGTHHNIDGRKRFGEYIGAKLISEGDTFRSTDTESGGSSIDVTTSVGQTIVVEEVDASGKPTKWKAADYQPRTHWDTEKTLYEGTLSFSDGVAFVSLSEDLVIGNRYSVTYNGVKYTLDCMAAPAAAEFEGCYIGSLHSDGEVPFGIVTVIVSGGTQTCVTTLGNDTTATLSVSSFESEKIPTRFVPTLEEMRTTETVGDIIPLTTFTPVLYEAFGCTTYPVTPFKLEEGKTYTVIFDGVSYNSTAVSYTLSETMEAIAIGNPVFGGGENNGMPFGVAVVDTQIIKDIHLSNPILLSERKDYMVLCMDTEQHTLQVIGEKTVYNKISEEYAKSNFVVEFVKNFADGSLAMVTPWEEITEAVKANKNIFGLFPCEESYEFDEYGNYTLFYYSKRLMCINARIGRNTQECRLAFFGVHEGALFVICTRDKNGVTTVTTTDDVSNI